MPSWRQAIIPRRVDREVVSTCLFAALNAASRIEFGEISFNWRPAIALTQCPIKSSPVTNPVCTKEIYLDLVATRDTHAMQYYVILHPVIICAPSLAEFMLVDDDDDDVRHKISSRSSFESPIRRIVFYYDIRPDVSSFLPWNDGAIQFCRWQRTTFSNIAPEFFLSSILDPSETIVRL